MWLAAFGDLDMKKAFWLSRLTTYNCVIPKIKYSHLEKKKGEQNIKSEFVASCMLIQCLCDLFFPKPDYSQGEVDLERLVVHTLHLWPASHGTNIIKILKE